MKKLQPVIIDARLVPKVWGGRSLETDLGIELPDDTLIGEAWIIYDRPDGSSKFRDTSTTLRDWMEYDPEGLLGLGVSPTDDGCFPLMLKLLDANSKLSVQCHPGPKVAAQRGDQAKTEAWVVLGKRDQGRLIFGFNQGVSRLQAIAALNTPQIETLLHTYHPEVGDCILVPPGTVHSPGPGLTLFEIQQNSETTYRLYDWGRDRELHLDASAETILVEHPETVALPTSPTPDGGEWLVRSQHFDLRRYSVVERPQQFNLQAKVMIITITEGRASITWESKEGSSAIAARQGETVLIPAVTKQVTLHPSGGCEILVTTPGHR